ncbi:MAG: DJ-1/PfpI family protein [Proteobacteria bacterium]|nr:DJ-1/PfpI family protein [Pseudomonadota bacterium]MBU1714747.1 DJ-1/PfpI family protein [Pseudomonadota bacterium]
MPSLLLLVAAGCEEIEAVTIIDVCRRAGIEVVSAGLDSEVLPVKCSRGTLLVPDTVLDQAMGREFDMLVLPGGQPGTDNLRKDSRVKSLIQDMERKGRYLAAICAAPMVLAEAGVLSDKKATSFPGCLSGLQMPDISLTEGPVVKDGRIITSCGPGTAIEFALELINVLIGREAKERVRRGLQIF